MTQWYSVQQEQLVNAVELLGVDSILAFLAACVESKAHRLNIKMERSLLRLVLKMTDWTDKEEVVSDNPPNQDL